MGLFSILLENTTATSNAGDENKGGSSNINNACRKSTFPTVVQLFHDSTPPFVFSNDTSASSSAMHKNKATTKKPILPKFAALHYSAIQCTGDDDDNNGTGMIAEATSPRGLRHRPNKEEIMLVPDLGVWNCRVLNNNNNLTDALLPLTMNNKSGDGGDTAVFCMVVDLVSLTPSQVEPVITQLQQALVRYLIQHGEQQQQQQQQQPPIGNEPPPITTFTTSLHDLKSVSFGLADQDEKGKAQISSSGTTAPEDRIIRIALHICVRVPNPHGTDEDDYTHQQEHQFFMYHLRKYAAALNASLVFVADDSTPVMESSPTESHHHHQRQPTVTVSQLAIIWRELAKGKVVWSEPVEGVTSTSSTQLSLPLEDQTTTNAPDATNPEEETYSLIYGPGHHQPELIESVLLRNGSYPGHWSASTDSVWKVFPPEKNADAGKSPTNKATTAAGDDAWLEELRASLASVPGLQTPPPKSSAKEPPSATRTPNDAAVSSFFEGLLK
jgi:hypothetical protein